MKYWLIFFLYFLTSTVHGAQTCFIAIDEKNTVICLQGSGQDERISPFSTFKIALSLMGFDSGILLDEQHPEWPCESQNLNVAFESWKAAQTPQTWIKNSVVWYSQKLAKQLGLDRIKHYLLLFDYGNQDMCGDQAKENGLTYAWLSSSLKISPCEQVNFLQKILCGKLPISPHAVCMTKRLLYERTLEDGWRLYGKTGTGYLRDASGNFLDNYSAWYVGWLEKGSQLFIFSLNIQGVGILPTKTERIEMVKKYFQQTMPPKEQSVVMVFGVFDLLHEGHRSFLNQAADYGSQLVVVVTRDSVAQLLKKRLPHDNEIERMQKVKSIEGISKIVLGDTVLGSYGVVKKYCPQIICLGYDQEALENDLKQQIAIGNLPNISLVRLNPYKPEQYHTSLLLNRY